MNGRFCGICAALAGSAVIAAATWALPAAAGRAQDSSQSTGDAVADAARKAREQKAKDTSKPKKVYTDEDVRHAVPPSEAANANPAGTDASKNAEGADAGKDVKGPGASDKGAGGKAGEAKENPEAVWRKKFKDAYADLARAEKELDILQREGNKAQLQYYSDPQKAMTEQYTRQEINEKDAKIAAKKDEVAQQKQKISDMEDALRKSGGDPGWATP